jgi:hypothetical protein
MLALVGAPDALAANAIQMENGLPGDSSWTAAIHDPIGNNAPIDGYANVTSVRPGGTITFQVTTNISGPTPGISVAGTWAAVGQRVVAGAGARRRLRLARTMVQHAARSKQRRRRRPEDAEREILEAADALLRVHPLHAVTVDAIMRRTTLSRNLF